MFGGGGEEEEGAGEHGSGGRKRREGVSKAKGKEERAEAVGMCTAKGLRGEREKGAPRKRGKKRQKARNVLSHSITPPLAHPTGLRSLQAPAGTATRHTVSNTMGHLVDHDIILYRSVTAGLKRMKCQNALSRSEKRKNDPHW